MEFFDKSKHLISIMPWHYYLVIVKTIGFFYFINHAKWFQKNKLVISKRYGEMYINKCIIE